MSEHAKAKVTRFNELLDTMTTITTDMEAEAGKTDTPENREKLTAKLTEAETLRKSIEQDNTILGLKTFVSEPAHESKAYGRGGDGVAAQPFTGFKSMGEQFIDSDGYKAMVEGGKVNQGSRVIVEAKG